MKPLCDLNWLRSSGEMCVVGFVLLGLAAGGLSQERAPVSVRFGTSFLNAEVLNSRANLDAALTLTKVPRGMFLDGDDEDEKTFEWEPEVVARIWYSTKPGSRQLNRYPNVTDATGSGQLKLNAAAEGMRTGVYYCILVAEEDTAMTSVEFKVIVQADAVPIANTPSEGTTLTESTPLFSWDPVSGVPYYFLFLSEGPLQIEQNDDGEITGLSGLNLTWQVVTPSTFMRYGDADPSGNFANAHVPPLLPGIEYNWLVLNAYSAGPDFISGEVAPVRPSSFEIAGGTSRGELNLLLPESDQAVSESEITFEWEAVSGASRYRFFLYEMADFQGNTIDYTKWSQITTTNRITLDANELLVRTNFQWRVVADSPDGRFHSERRGFRYEGPAGWAKFTVDSEEGPQSRVIVDIRNEIDRSLLLPAVTDTFGVVKVALAVGDYSFTASRPGFIASKRQEFTVPDNDTLALEATLVRSPTTITGQVVDEDGDPVFDATLVLTSGARKVVENSDESGYFWFAVPSGSWSLTAHKRGFTRSSTVNILLGEDEGKDVGQIELVRATNVVTGTVTFADDRQPFPGVFVRAQDKNLTYQAASNSQGGFRFELGPGTWKITLDARGFYTSPTEYTFELTSNEQISAPFQLFSGGLITGKITFRDLGLTDAVIGLFDKDTGNLVQRATSNVQGHYALGAQEGTYNLVASRPGFITVSQDVSVATGETLIRDFELSEAGFVKGTVTNLETFTPMPGAQIFVISDSTIRTTSDADGKYVLSLRPGEPTQIDATLNGFGSNGPFTVNAASGDTVVQDIFLRPLSGTITGTVTDGFAPVNGALVTILELGEQQVTGPDGRFQFDISPGDYSLQTSKECHFTTTQEVELVAGETLALEILLQPLRSVVAGRVTDESENPIESAEIVATRVTSESEAPVESVVIADTSDAQFSGVTDSNGRYFLCLDSGIFRVTANKPGFLSAETTVIVSDGDSLGGIDFQLEENFASLSGRVLDDANSPVQMATVTLTNEDQSLVTQTGGDGRFELVKIIPGLSTISASNTGYYGSPITLFLQGRQHLDISLTLYPADGVISGTAFDSADSTGIAEVLVSAQFSGDPETFFNDTTDAAGHYSISNLPVVPEMSYRVFAFKDGFASPAPREGVVPDTAGLDFFLINKIGRIAGRVLSNENNQPLEKARVEATNQTGGRSTGLSDQTGHFEIGGLIPTDVYTVTAKKGGFFAAGFDGVVPGDTTIVLRLDRKFGFVKGRVVLGESSAGLSDVLVRAKPKTTFGQGQVSSTKTGQNGEFMFTLIADDYILQPVLTHHRIDPDAREVTVPEVDTIQVEDFVLQPQTVQSIIISRSDQSDDPVIPNTAAACYTVSAKDVNGDVVTIGSPVWSLDVSERAATIDSVGCLRMNPRFFGNLTVTATDPVSEVQGALTVGVFSEVGPETDATLFDDRGLELRIRPGALSSNRQLQVSKQPIALAKRGRAEFVTLDSSFVIKPASLEFDQSVSLSLPAPPNSEEQRVVLARWDSDLSQWIEIEDTLPKENNRYEGGIDLAGEYVSLAVAKPLTLGNVSLLPNPFSPFHEVDGKPGLKIEFDLSSNAAPNPLVSVKIYNLEGNLVRLLHDQTPFARGHSTVFWDGKADNGAMARNGRYLVRFVVEDPAERREVLKSVVLIK